MRQMDYRKYFRLLWLQRRRDRAKRRNRILRDIRPIYNPRYERGRNGSREDRRG